MLIRSFIIFTVLCVSHLLAQSNILDNQIVTTIRDVANSENVPNSELEKAYIAYEGAHLWGHKLNYEGAQDFGEIFDNMRIIVNKLEYVKNSKLSDATFEVMKKYEDLPYDDGNKAKLTDDLNYIALGLVGAME